uniref:Nucleosome-remodeling factor subunit NURF301 n=1 Tax=Phallusia mammillata TaxID=59560 RepID=A0A6F9D899_9ASCI|nr:nucleosome-remodeling factor subunit NURF301 [Phallusia mammillata]
MPRHKKYLDDLMANEPADGRLRLELRKLSNSDGWVASTAKESSGNSSRASTPQSHGSSVIGNSGTSTGAKRGRPRKNPYPNLTTVKKKKKGRPRLDKPKQFKMVLEKDDEFEVDYITPDEDDSGSETEAKDSISYGSLSDEDHFLDNDDDDVSSVEDKLSVFESSAWLDEDETIEETEIPKLELPESSDDLLIDRKLVMPALAVYEVLRHFRNTLRLSPMLFEDFCAAIASTETTVVLNECHIALLKALVKEDEHLGTTFVPQDQKDAYNIAFYFMDYLTWPEVLRYFVESSPEFKYILPVVENKDFPSVEPQQKLEVLQFLTNLYLSSTKIRDELMMDGTIHYDDHCRVCHRLGDLLCCETCPAVYHLACCNPPLKEVPEDEWQCGICVAHKLNGVSNCESEQETNGQYLRHDPIGTDRHGRKYWFLARRLIIEGDDDTHYYSTVEEFEYMKSKLDPDKWEMTLCEALVDVAEEFPRHAEITEQLTNEAKWSEEATTWLDTLKDRVQKSLDEESQKAEEKRKLEEKKKREREEEEKKKREQAEEEKREREREEKEKREEEGRIKEEQEKKQTEESEIKDNEVESEENQMDTAETVTTEQDELKPNVENMTESMDSNQQSREETTSLSGEMEVDCGEKSNNESVPLPSTTEEVVCETVEESHEMDATKEEPKDTDTEKSVASTDQVGLKPPALEVDVSEESSDTKSATSSEESKTPQIQTPPATEHQPLPVAQPSTPSAAADKSNVPILPKLQPVASSTASPQVVKLFPKQQNFLPIKLANIKVPLSRCDAMVNTTISPKPKTATPVAIASPVVQPKPASTSLTSLRNLFVLGKDGVRTPITIGPGGKIIAGGNQKIVLINSQQNANKNGQQVGKTDKVSRELRKLQFSGAGPKMQKIGPVTVGQNQNTTNLNSTGNTMQQHNTTVANTNPHINKPPFKLGEDGGYKQYKNYYVENTLALNKYQHKEDKDRDRHVGYKFSIGGPVEFEWTGDTYGSREEIVHTLRSALFRFEQQIPLCFMHSKWEQYRKMWGRMLLKNDSSRAFAVVLGILEMAIRNNVKRTVWKESMGQSRMRRLLSTEKEVNEKKKKHKAKAEEDIANRHAVWCKYPLPIRSVLVWKMKGEEYRITGYGGWMWLSSSFKLMNKPCSSKPYTLMHKSRPTKTEEKNTNLPKEAKTEGKNSKTDDNQLKDAKLEEKCTENDDSQLKAAITEESSTKKDGNQLKDAKTEEESSKIDKNQLKDAKSTETDDNQPKDESMSNETVEPGDGSKKEKEKETESETNSSDQKLAEELALQVAKLVEACEVIDVSKNLLVRSVLYNRKWKTTKVDKLLRWRILQEKQRLINNKPPKSGEDTSSTEVSKPTDSKKPIDCDELEISDDESKTVQDPPAPKTDIKQEQKSEDTPTSAAESLSSASPNQTSVIDRKTSTEPVKAEEDASLAKQEPQSTAEPDLEVDKDAESVENDEQDTSPMECSTAANVEAANKQDSDTEADNHKHETAVSSPDPVVKQDEVTIAQESSPAPSSEPKPSELLPSVRVKTESPETLSDTKVNKQEFSEKTSEPSDSSKDVSVTDTTKSSGAAKDTNNGCSTDTEKLALKPDLLDKTSGTKLQSPNLPEEDLMDVDEKDELSTPKAQQSKPETLCNGIDHDFPESNKQLTTTTTVTTTLTETVVVNVTTSNNSACSNNDVSQVVTSTTTTKSTKVETVAKISSPKSSPTSVIDTSTLSVDNCNPVAPKSEKLSDAFDKTLNDAHEGVAVGTYDEIFKSSTMHVDHGTGEVGGNVVHRQLSRRFRAVKKPEGIVKTVESSKVESTTSKTWKLKRSPGDSNKKKGNEIKMPLPWKFSYGKGRRKNIFRLPFPCIRNLAQRGGVAWNPTGFHVTPKWPSGIELFWPYPCPRPTIGTVWRYKVQNAGTLAAIAHLLRVLWHSMRWDDIVTSPVNDDMVHVVHTDDDIITTELLKRRDSGSTGLKSEYYVRRIRMPTSEYDEEIPRSEEYTPSSRSGLRTRSRPIGLRERTRKDASSNPRVETLWLPEEQIELWQIRQFHTMLRTQQKVTQPSNPSSLIGATKIRLTPQEKVVSLTQGPVRSPMLSSKNVTITPALLQQAAALHKSQVDNRSNDQIKKLILKQTSDGSTIRRPDGQAGTPLRTITIKSPTPQHTQFIALKSVAPATPTSGNTFIQVAGGQALIKSGSQFIMQGNKMIPGRQIIFKQSLVPSSASGAQSKPSLPTASHPTIRLASKSAPGKSPQTPQKAAITSQSPQSTPTSSKSSRMQVTLSSAQLTQLMRVGTDTRVRVSIKLSDGRPGIGQLQVIPPGVQVTPTQGQQLMQCKVGNEVRKFLLTAISEKAPLTPQTPPSTPSTPVVPINTPLSPQTPVAANEVSIETPSLKHRLLQLHQRHHGLLKQPGMDVKQLMTDKDPLWGGRPHSAEKPVVYERQTIKKEMIERAKKRQSFSRESREGQQRKAVVQQLMKSLLDKIERKEELEARRRRKEEHLEQQKRKRESLDEAKSQQRLHHRLLHALRKHEEQLKQEIRKRRTITEKYITRVVENELYEDQVKYGKRKQLPNTGTTQFSPQEGATQTTPKRQRKISSHYSDKLYGNVLAESNRRKSSSPKKSSAKESRKREATSDIPQDLAPTAAKKKKMINTSTKLYCVCKTPYDETKFYIGCDLCMNWFHGSCVGISEKKAKAMETWVCQDCAKEQSAPQQELYCFCRTPYDDAKFYIGCDICQDWYHGSCVGISEEEASGIESYTCPRCKQGSRDASQEGALNDRDYFNLTKIVRHLQGHKMAWPFLEPVREEDAPNYYRVVKRPMDIQTVLKRLECRYYMKLSELVGDVSLIFDNCRQYNGADSKIVRCAEIVESVFVGRIRELRGRQNRR